jgi:hypothetical protein
MLSFSKVISNKIKNKTTFYLCIVIITLIIIIAIIVLIDISDKNTTVQPYLSKYAEIREDMINPNYKVNHVNNIIVVDDFLKKDFFMQLREQFDNKTYESKDFMLRKATGVDFFKLHQQSYPGILEFFYSGDLMTALTSIIKKPVQRISLSDPNSCSLIIYTNAGDHIDWHLDYSNYYGDRFVVLLTIVNENREKDGGLSSNIFKYNYDGETHELQMKENSIVIFKGSEIFHKATAIEDGERRILLSMVMCDICQEKQKNIVSILYEKVKSATLYQ